MSVRINQQVEKNLIDLDATEIASLIQAKQITSEEVTATLIDHIQHVNPSLNAVVEDRYELALKEARKLDRQIDQVNFLKKPLYGVPVSIKEAFHVKGMKTTGGISHRKDIIMSMNAKSVQKLIDAGAIILCKTNTPALSFAHETDNKLYGRTNNAWDKTRTAGGSSGGEAALIAVGGSYVGLSSDIGGSIRLPSHFNGVVGFKPGKFQVSSEGHFPPDTLPLKSRMTGIGPIGKSVRDVQLVYEIIANSKHETTQYKKLEVEVLPVDNGYPLSETTGKLLESVYEKLKSMYEVNYSIPPYFNDSANVWQEIMSIDGGKEIAELAFNTDRVNIWKHYLEEALTKKTPTHRYLSWALIGANMFKPSKKRIAEIESFIKEGEPIVNSYLNNRILIFPVYRRSALKHGQLYKEIFSIKKSYTKLMPYLAYANVWGLPSLTVPVGFDEEHLPIGIQLISRIGNEAALFSLGKVIEDKFGGYIRSTLYD